MERPDDAPPTETYTAPSPSRPGKVVKLRGVIFQSDDSSWLGAALIRPLEAFDRWQGGLARGEGSEPLAMHAGLHVEIEDGREFVAEQLFGTFNENFKDALNWTPIEQFRTREHSGWDVTVPAQQFRGIEDPEVAGAVDYLNKVQGKPFFGEDCVAFIERTFSGKRLFGDSPTGLALGIGLRVGDPALPLLQTNTNLDARARHLLRFTTVSKQVDPTTDQDSPNARVWAGRVIVWSVVAGVIWGLWELTRYKERPRLRF